MEYRIIGWTCASSEDFPELDPDKKSALRDLIKREILKKAYVFSGDYHEWGDYGCPVFNSGEKYVTSTRGWAHLMAEIYEAEGTRAYSRWMFDEWVEATEVGKCGLRYPTEGVDYSEIVDESELSLPTSEPPEAIEFSVEEYVEMLKRQKEYVEALGIRTLPSAENDPHPLTVNMTLNEAPFYQICEGKKKVELRLFDEKRARLAVGDKLQLELKGNHTKYIIAYVKELHLADSFRDLLTPELLPLCGFEGETAESAAQIMRGYYTEEEERKYGVVGIELDVRHIVV